MNKAEIIKKAIIDFDNIENAIFQYESAIIRMKWGTFQVDETTNTIKDYQRRIVILKKVKA